LGIAEYSSLKVRAHKRFAFYSFHTGTGDAESRVNIPSQNLQTAFGVINALLPDMEIYSFVFVLLVRSRELRFVGN
jgi:hypothetical protein